MEELDWPAQIPDLDPIKHLWINWNTDCEPDHIIQHQCPIH
uniref:Uncharacterized protein n=1 Tax=Anguilla anguilla TaxID=7936 RepID=A0A0E9RD52_ANGAN